MSHTTRLVLALLISTTLTVACAACGPEGFAGTAGASDASGTVTAAARGCSQQTGCPGGEEGTGGAGDAPGATPIRVEFDNDSVATRLFFVDLVPDAGARQALIVSTELKPGQSAIGPASQYSATTRTRIHAEVRAHYGETLATMDVYLSPTAAAASCVLKYREFVPGTGGRNIIDTFCSQ